MRTLIFIAAGLAVLALLMLQTKPSARAKVALGFILAWSVVSAVNFGVGLSHGYSIADELAVHAFLWGLPAAAALACFRRWRKT